MKGRKAIPTKLHAIRGNPGKRPLNDKEPMPPEGMPECPPHLDELARAEWARVGPQLNDIGLMSPLDMAIFAAYCQHYSRLAVSTQIVNKQGSVLKRKDGTPMLNPHLRVARESYDGMMKAATVLGIGAANRRGLKVEKPKEKSKVQAFMDRKNGKKA